MTQDEIIRMAREAAQLDGTNPPDKSVTLYAAKSSRFLEKFAALVAAAEREACEGLCGELANNTENSEQYRMAANWCRERIRARGNT